MLLNGDQNEMFNGICLTPYQRSLNLQWALPKVLKWQYISALSRSIFQKKVLAWCLFWSERAPRGVNPCNYSNVSQHNLFTFCVLVTKAIINAKLPTLTSIGHAQLCRSKSKYFLWRQIVSQSPNLFLAFWQSFLLLSIICVCIIWLSKL